MIRYKLPMTISFTHYQWWFSSSLSHLAGLDPMTSRVWIPWVVYPQGVRRSKHIGKMMGKWWVQRISTIKKCVGWCVVHVFFPMAFSRQFSARPTFPAENFWPRICKASAWPEPGGPVWVGSWAKCAVFSRRPLIIERGWLENSL